VNTVGVFTIAEKPWPGGGKDLRVALDRHRLDGDGPILTPGCVSEGEWSSQIRLLIEDLRAVEKRGLKMLRAAAARGPQPITED